ncbi:MAG TPA: hypothetical protein VJU78_10445 [Chitinophagaceae bacterium]|nr:hypothetical protein [Chitinophagaceae bacterium]
MKKIYFLLIILLILEFLLALVCGPYSCDWGNTVYFYSGITFVLISFILPLLQKQWPTGKRIGFAFLFAMATLIVWLLGFIAGDFRIMCRLF